MKDRVINDIGARNQEDRINWSTIDWIQSYKKVKNLRHRIYRATKEKDWNKVRSLTKLMMRSQSNLLESVRKVTQDNKGRKTAGIDKKKALTSYAREKLCKELREYTPPHAFRLGRMSSVVNCLECKLNTLKNLFDVS